MAFLGRSFSSGKIRSNILETVGLNIDSWFMQYLFLFLLTMYIIFFDNLSVQIFVLLKILGCLFVIFEF
jgi:hypothetical protein